MKPKKDKVKIPIFYLLFNIITFFISLFVDLIFKDESKMGIFYENIFFLFILSFYITTIFLLIKYFNKLETLGFILIINNSIEFLVALLFHTQIVESGYNLKTLTLIYIQPSISFLISLYLLLKNIKLNHGNDS
jgi:hypothetical protein